MLSWAVVGTDGLRQQAALLSTRTESSTGRPGTKRSNYLLHRDCERRSRLSLDLEQMIGSVDAVPRQKLPAHENGSAAEGQGAVSDPSSEGPALTMFLANEGLERGM